MYDMEHEFEYYWIRKIFGTLIFLVGLVIILWSFKMVCGLWNSPESVGLVQKIMAVDFKTVILGDIATFEIPKAILFVVGVVLAVMIITLAISLGSICIAGAYKLFVPSQSTWMKHMTRELSSIRRVMQKQDK